MQAPKATDNRSQGTALHFALILLLGLLAYSNTFGVPFVFDDIPIITENPLISDVSNIPSFFAGKSGPFASRPLMYATLALNYRFGGFGPKGYHAVNLALHLINALLLYFLVLLTGRRLGHTEEDARRTAILSSSLFVAHPALSEGVIYIVSRTALFATAFYLAGTILFLKAATEQRYRGLYIAGLFATSFLGMASREDFAMFPLMLVIYDLLFVSELKPKEALKHWKAYLPAVLSLAYLAYLVLNNSYDRSADYPGVGVPQKDYFLTQFNVHWTYLRLLVLPINLNLDYDYPIARTLSEFPTLIAFAGYIGLWALSFIFAKKRPAVSFSLLWFLVILLPISFVVTLLGLRLDDVISEHRLYLPSVGLFVIPALAANSLFGKFKAPRLQAAVFGVSILLVLSLAAGTLARNMVWHSRASLWKDAIAKSPNKARPHLNLGVVYASEGSNQEAIEEFKTARRMATDYLFIYEQLGSTYFQMANVYMSMGLADRAIDYYRMAINLWPGDERLHITLARAYQKIGESEKAHEQLRIAEDLKRKTEQSTK